MERAAWHARTQLRAPLPRAFRWHQMASQCGRLRCPTAPPLKIRGFVPCNESKNQRQNDRSDHGNNDRHDDPVIPAETDMFGDKSSDERADYADDDIHQRAVATALHQLSCDPACDKTNNDPPNEAAHSENLRVKF